MLWEVSDVDQHKKGLTESQKRRWVEVANDALATCLRDGGEDCDAAAIKQANAAVEEAMHEHESLGERILEAVFDEAATYKSAVQGLLVAANAVARHKAVPKKVKDQISGLRKLLASKTWADIRADEEEGGKGTVDTSEAVRLHEGVAPRAGQSISDFQRELEVALGGHLNLQPHIGFWITDIFSEFLVYEIDGKLYRVPYMMTAEGEGAVVFGNQEEVRRKTTYVPLTPRTAPVIGTIPAPVTADEPMEAEGVTAVQFVEEGALVRSES